MKPLQLLLALLPAACAFFSPAASTRAASTSILSRRSSCLSHASRTRVLPLAQYAAPETSSGGGGSLPPIAWRGRGRGDDGEGDGSDGGDAVDLLRQSISFAAAAATTAVSIEASERIIKRQEHTDALPAARSLRGGANYRSKRRLPRGLQEPSVTLGLLAVTIAGYALQWLYPSLTMRGAKLTHRMVRHGEWYRLFTPMLLHGSLGHLLVNSLSLYNIGPFVDQLVGPKRMLAFYVLSGVAGNALSAYCSPASAGVGASGAIAGMIGAAGCHLALNKDALGPGAQRILNGIARTVAMNAFIGLQVSNIDNMAHLGGFLFGGVLAAGFGPVLSRNRLTGQITQGPARLSLAPRTKSF